MNKKKISIFLLVITFIFVISSQTLAVTNLKVTGLSVKVSDTSVVATWNKLDTAIGYEIYVNIQNRGYQYLGAVTSNTVTINGFIKGEDYAIKVKAFTYQNGTKVDGTFSEEVKFTAGKQPQTEESNLNKVTNLSVTVNDVSEVTFNWNAVIPANAK